MMVLMGNVNGKSNQRPLARCPPMFRAVMFRN